MDPGGAGSPSAPRTAEELVRLDNLATRVVAAVGADTVGQLGLPTMGTGRVGGGLGAPMGAPHAHFRSRLSSFGYGHCFLLAVRHGRSSLDLALSGAFLG